MTKPVQKTTKNTKPHHPFLDGVIAGLFLMVSYQMFWRALDTGSLLHYAMLLFFIVITCRAFYLMITKLRQRLRK